MTHSDPFTEDYALYYHCNHTELHQVARSAGHNVHPNYSRQSLIRIIIGQEAAPNVGNEIDSWRRALIVFIADHRRVLETQVTCPARCLFEEPYGGLETQEAAQAVEKEEDACFSCIDTQVVTCLTSNGDANFKLIQLRKKNA